MSLIVPPLYSLRSLVELSVPRRQFGLKIGGRGSSFENWGSYVLKRKRMEARSTRLRVSSPEMYLIIHKSFYLWKVTTLKSVLISYSCTLYDIVIFHGTPRTPTTSILKYGGHDPKPLGLTPMSACTWCSSWPDIRPAPIRCCVRSLGRPPVPGSRRTLCPACIRRRSTIRTSGGRAVRRRESEWCRWSRCSWRWREESRVPVLRARWQPLYRDVPSGEYLRYNIHQRRGWTDSEEGWRRGSSSAAAYKDTEKIKQRIHQRRVKAAAEQQKL